MKKKNKDSILLLAGLLGIAGVGGFVVYRKQQEQQTPPAVDTSAPSSASRFGVSYTTVSNTNTVNKPFSVSGYVLNNMRTNPVFQGILPASGGNNAISTAYDPVGTGFGVNLPSYTQPAGPVTFGVSGAYR